jgi:hypothetical protein
MSAAVVITAQGFLLAHREDYERVYAEFRWPVLDRFNRALDYFDLTAQRNDRPALWIVDEKAAARPGCPLPNVSSARTGWPITCAFSNCAAATAC